MPSRSRSRSSPIPVPVVNGSSGRGYKWVFVALIAILLIVFLYTYMHSSEGFENGTATLMYFFMPECGHCKKFNPEWEKMQGKIDTNRAPIRLSKIDGTEDANKQLVTQYNVRGFPTIVLEIGIKTYTYNGERTAEAVYSWAIGLMGK